MARKTANSLATADGGDLIALDTSPAKVNAPPAESSIRAQPHGLPPYTFTPSSTNHKSSVVQPRKKSNATKQKRPSLTRPKVTSTKVKREPRSPTTDLDLLDTPDRPEELAADDEVLNAASILMDLHKEAQDVLEQEDARKIHEVDDLGPVPFGSVVRFTQPRYGTNRSSSPRKPSTPETPKIKTHRLTPNDHAHPNEPTQPVKTNAAPPASFTHLATITEEDQAYFTNPTLEAIHSSPAKPASVRTPKLRQVEVDEYGVSTVDSESDTTELESTEVHFTGNDRARNPLYMTSEKARAAVRKTRRVKEEQSRAKVMDMFARDVPTTSPNAEFKRAQLSLANELLSKLGSKHGVNTAASTRSPPSRPRKSIGITTAEVTPRARHTGPVHISSLPKLNSTPKPSVNLSPRAKLYIPRQQNEQKSPLHSPERVLLKTPPRSRAANQVPATPSSALLLAAQYATTTNPATPGLGEWLMHARKMHAGGRTPSLESMLGRAAGQYGAMERGGADEKGQGVVAKIEVLTGQGAGEVRESGMKAREMGRRLAGIVHMDVDVDEIDEIEAMVGDGENDVDVVEDGEVEDGSEAETVILTPAWQRRAKVKEMQY